MEYHRITQSREGKDVLQPISLTVSEIWGEERPLFVPGREGKAGRQPAFLPFYEIPGGFLISARVRYLWQEYQRGGRYRPCAFGSVARKQIRAYCFLMPRLLDCIHPDTRYDKKGDPEELWLDRGQIGAHQVFGVRTGRGIRLILGEEVLERMLGEGITGFDWERAGIK